MSQVTPENRFVAEPSVRDHFAWVRTRLGLERTYIAWIRTAISLIGFGFTIVQFFQRLQEMKIPGVREMRPREPRDLGLALIATGIGALVISTWQYYAILHYLRSKQFAAISQVSAKPRQTPAFFCAMVLIAIGIAAFVSVFFHFL
jgi:putative membrane protein